MVICLAPAEAAPLVLLFLVSAGSVIVVGFAWAVHGLEAQVPTRWGGRPTPGRGEPSV
jgi:hypothetical protein